jgi:hypothetical protein
MDNVAFASYTPHEDEFALAAMTTVSPYMKVLFPDTEDGDCASLDPSKLSHESLERWKRGFETFLKKLSVIKNDRLVIKAPPHTARIPILMEMFPEAKFVYIYRNPYDVFASTKILWEKAFGPSALQVVSWSKVDELILSWYSELFQLYQRDKLMIPKGSLHEMRFEDLEADPIKELEALYKELGLEGFREFQASVSQYLKSIEGYSKNRLRLDTVDVELVNARWAESFTKFGYEMRRSKGE